MVRIRTCVVGIVLISTAVGAVDNPVNDPVTKSENTILSFITCRRRAKNEKSSTVTSDAKELAKSLALIASSSSVPTTNLDTLNQETVKPDPVDSVQQTSTKRPKVPPLPLHKLSSTTTTGLSSTKTNDSDDTDLASAREEYCRATLKQIGRILKATEELAAVKADFARVFEYVRWWRPGEGMEGVMAESVMMDGLEGGWFSGVSGAEGRDIPIPSLQGADEMKMVGGTLQTAANAGELGTVQPQSEVGVGCSPRVVDEFNSFSRIRRLLHMIRWLRVRWWRARALGEGGDFGEGEVGEKAEKLRKEIIALETGEEEEFRKLKRLKSGMERTSVEKMLGGCESGNQQDLSNSGNGNLVCPRPGKFQKVPWSAWDSSSEESSADRDPVSSDEDYDTSSEDSDTPDFLIHKRRSSKRNSSSKRSSSKKPVLNRIASHLSLGSMGSTCTPPSRCTSGFATTPGWMTPGVMTPSNAVTPQHRISFTSSRGGTGGGGGVHSRDCSYSRENSLERPGSSCSNLSTYEPFIRRSSHASTSSTPSPRFDRRVGSKRILQSNSVNDSPLPAPRGLPTRSLHTVSVSQSGEQGPCVFSLISMLMQGLRRNRGGLVGKNIKNDDNNHENKDAQHNNAVNEARRSDPFYEYGQRLYQALDDELSSWHTEAKTYADEEFGGDKAEGWRGKIEEKLGGIRSFVKEGTNTLLRKMISVPKTVGLGIGGRMRKLLGRGEGVGLKGVA